MKQVNGEVRLLIIMTMVFVFTVPVGFLVITTASDQHDQEDIRDTGGAGDAEEAEDAADGAGNSETDLDSDANGGDDSADADDMPADDDDTAPEDTGESGMESDSNPD
jgi:midasin (ATPase involved in ribosome maturation)